MGRQFEPDGAHSLCALRWVTVDGSIAPDPVLNRPGFCSYCFPWIAVANTGEFSAGQSAGTSPLSCSKVVVAGHSAGFHTM